MKAPERILLVEDDADAALLTTRALESRWPAIKVSHYQKLQPAVELSHQEQFDLLVLDLDLPDSRGLETLKTFVRQGKPGCAIVILTNYRDEEKAIEALGLGAQDYLFKDAILDEDTFARSILFALQRKKQVEKREEPERFDQNSIFVKDRGRLRRVMFDEITWLEALGDYTTIKTSSGLVKVLAVLRNLLGQLPPGQFVRIHRSYAVAVEKISSLKGNSLVIGDDELPIGPSFKNDLLKRLNVVQ